MLIHDATAGAAGVGFPHWRDWLAQAGVDGIDAERGLRINASAAVIQAAIAGQGVALGRKALIERDLAAGLLVKPFDAPVLTLRRCWHVVHRPDTASQPKVAAFRNWLLAEAARTTE